MTQAISILTALRAGETITVGMAYKRWGCRNLVGQIYRLRQRGIPITTMVTTEEGGRVVAYSLLPQYRPMFIPSSLHRKVPRKARGVSEGESAVQALVTFCHTLLRAARAHWIGGSTLRQIERTTGVGRMVISRFAKKHGLPIREAGLRRTPTMIADEAQYAQWEDFLYAQISEAKRWGAA